MNDTSHAKPRRRRGLWWKIPLTLLLLLVLALAVVWFNLSSIATNLANKKLPGLLGTEASVERIELRLSKGLAAIHGLRIGQPEGFDGDTLLVLDRVMAQVDLGSIKSGEGILIPAVELEGLKADLVKDADGVFNFLSFGPPAAHDASGKTAEAVTSDEESETAEIDDAEEAPAEDGKPFPGVRIQNVSISDVAVNYTDQTTGERPIEIGLGNLDIQLTDTQVLLADGPEVTLGDGSITLEKVHIAQPPGFGDDALLTLPRVHLEIGAAPFTENVVRLDRLEAEGLRAHIISDANGVINATRLGGGPAPTPTAGQDEEPVSVEEAMPDQPEARDTAAVDEPTEPESTPVGIHLGALALTDFAVTYTDAALGGEAPMEFVLQDLALNVEDLMVFLSEPPVTSSPVVFEAALLQGESPPALFTLQAALGPVEAGVPDVNAQAKLSGFMLDTVGSLIPSGARTAIGADGLDLQVGLALDASSIDLQGTVDTDGGHDYPVLVKGPLAKPHVDLGPLMFAMAGRLTGGVQNLATGGAGAAVDVAQGVTDGATDLAKGTKDTVSKFGGGLFKTAAAALTLDVEKAGEGLRDATVGAAHEVSGAVATTKDGVVSTAKEGADSISGGKASSAWLDETPKRHAADVETAKYALEEMPFPPPSLPDSVSE